MAEVMVRLANALTFRAIMGSLSVTIKETAHQNIVETVTYLIFLKINYSPFSYM